ncbi:hypothetical protein AMTR_s00151p00093280 [Amborella trichopoda]|uniref:Uncharacterized protein n=1 Tax=Amborella trichopoda TaxID=13333 RepID=W1NJW5_AMBTC|nr:hypothetical protein AMTR_s00151p00093280 [Amborella trichopoda]
MCRGWTTKRSTLLIGIQRLQMREDDTNPTIVTVRRSIVGRLHIIIGMSIDAQILRSQVPLLEFADPLAIKTATCVPHNLSMSCLPLQASIISPHPCPSNPLPSHVNPYPTLDVHSRPDPTVASNPTEVNPC